MTAITERVAAGAAFLDEHDPGWWQADVPDAIDLRTLRLESTGSCILGQRCPLEALKDYIGPDDYASWGADAFAESRYWAYAFALSQLDNESDVFGWAQELGFAEHPVTADYDALTAEWARVISGRRAAS